MFARLVSSPSPEKFLKDLREVLDERRNRGCMVQYSTSPKSLTATDSYIVYSALITWVESTNV